MIICLSHQQFDVSGTNYFVGTDGDDSKDCTVNLCLTLEARIIKVMANFAHVFTVIIRGLTTISSSFDLSETFPSPRTFRNNPDLSSTLSDIHIYSNGQFIVTGNALFQTLKFTKLNQATQNNGGAIYALFNELSCNLQIIDCVFVDCKTKSKGGAFCFETYVKTDTTLKDIAFQHCESQNEGGAFQCSINNGAKLTIAGSWSFQDCKTLSDSGYGGALYASVYGENSQLIFETFIMFERCSGQTGGAMYLLVQRLGKVTITEQCNFTNCNSSNIGGSIYLETNNGTINFNQTEQIFIENCACDGCGGGIYCSISNNGQISFNNMKLSYCNSIRDGGGIYASINGGGQLILDKACEFYQCECHGNGGGIYTIIDSTTQCTFIIKDASIHECKSVTDNSLSYPESGFGGGLFLGTFGNYYPSTELIDLRGIKIYNNSVDKYGQRLYIVMKDVIEIEKNLRNYDNEIIYPPEDGSSNPIQIIGEIESEQTASFGM
ncbi:MAG: hypothetical protein EZS28_039238, partial [Streblomastix strix]